MALESFTSGDAGRSARRFATSYGAALLVMCALLGGLIMMPKTAAQKEDAVVDIRLVLPPPPEPEPPPPPPKPLEVPKPKPAAVKREVKIEKTPEPVATIEPPKPAPPAPAAFGAGKATGPAKPGQATVSSGSLGGAVGGTGTGVGRVVPPAASAPPPPRVVALSEDTEPPVAIAQAQPAYPPALKAEGVEGFVVVRFIVTESGAVDDVRIVKSSDPRFNEGVLATVKAWRFKPATSQGRPVAYPKTIKIPFKIRT